MIPRRSLLASPLLMTACMHTPTAAPTPTPIAPQREGQHPFELPATAGLTEAVRAYHGATDNVVPLAHQQECIDALRACGGKAELIIYPGVGHDAWNPGYDDPALVPWLMAQVRR